MSDRSAVSALLLTLLLTSAQPEAQRVAVLPIIIAPDKELTASVVFKQVTDAAQLRPSLRVMSIDDYYFNDGGQLANRALACGSDTKCIATTLKPFAAQVGVVVIANLELSLLSVRLLDAKTKETIGVSSVESAPAEMPAKIFEELSKLLDKAGHPRSGRLVVKVDPGRAAISLVDIDVKPDVGESNVFTLPPGEYRVVAKADGFEEASKSAVVRSGEATTLEVALLEESSLIESPWFWVVGSAIVVAAGATVAAIALSGQQRCLCVLTKDSMDCTVCQ